MHCGQATGAVGVSLPRTDGYTTWVELSRLMADDTAGGQPHRRDVFELIGRIEDYRTRVDASIGDYP
jgi:hypothetical protein